MKKNKKTSRFPCLQRALPASRSNKGFTLVEVLVTIVVIGVIGYMLSDILIRSLNNGRKSQVIGNVKQNAQVALTTMSTAIRNADAITCTNLQPTPLNPGNVIVTLNKDGTYTRFSYQAPGVGNGYLVEDFPTVANVFDSDKLCDFATYPLVGQVQMTDSSTVSGVSVNQSADTSGNPVAIFTVIQNVDSKDSVIIKFDFNSNTGNRGIQNTLGSPSHYETTVQLR